MASNLRIAAWICLGILIGFMTFEGCDGDQEILQQVSYRACREDNVTFSWSTPANMTNISFVDLVFAPKVVDNGTNAKDIIWSVSADSESTNSRYKGRLHRVLKADHYSFRLENVNPKDRGKYELLIVTRGTTYKGEADLTVYAEDNLWPIEDSGSSSTTGDSDAAGMVYHYPFLKPEESPVIGIEMVVKAKDGPKENCYFGNTSRCSITFTEARLEGLTGIIKFGVNPIFGNNSIRCDAVKMPYDYKITIMRDPLSSALVGGIIISALIAIAACVIPPVIINIKKKREKYLPLKGGYGFLKGCIDRIECTPDISDVYRKNANSKMIHPHVQSYFQDPKAQEGFFQDEGLTKIYFAAFIKHYIANVREPILSLEFIQRVKHGERDENFNLEDTKSLFKIRKNDSRSLKERKRIMRLLIQHFHWFRNRKIEADGSDSAEHSPSKILTTTGLCGLLAMNFDRSESTPDIEEFNKVARLTRFLRSLITHCQEIFGPREDINGSLANDSHNVTLDPLLDEEESIA